MHNVRREQHQCKECTVEGDQATDDNNRVPDILQAKGCRKQKLELTPRCALWILMAAASLSTCPSTEPALWTISLNAAFRWLLPALKQFACGTCLP